MIEQLFVRDASVVKLIAIYPEICSYIKSAMWSRLIFGRLRLLRAVIIIAAPAPASAPAPAPLEI